MAVDIRNRNFPVERFSPLLRSKACEARPVDETASKVWRRGQNIQGVCRRIFWEPQEFAFAGANCRGFKTFLSGSTRFLLVTKEMGWCLLKKQSLSLLPSAKSSLATLLSSSTTFPLIGEFFTQWSLKKRHNYQKNLNFPIDKGPSSRYNI